MEAESDGQRKSSEPTLQEQLSDPAKSAVQRYQALVVGSLSWWHLIKFELITMLVGGLPGALGLILRKHLYPHILGSVGRNVIFGRGMTLRHAMKIHVGSDVVIDDFTVLDAKGESNTGITLGDSSFVSRSAVLSCKNGNIWIGKGSVVGINNLVHAMDGSSVTVGDDVLIAAFVYLIGSGPYATDKLDVPFKKQGMIPQGGVNIENNVWIGSGVHILDGVTVGKGSILASGAVINKSVAAFSVMGGVPAKLIKSRQ